MGSVSEPSRNAQFALYAPLAAGFIAIQVLYLGFVADDSGITARYAENLIDHGEWVFNRGERVCAFTSPLHVVLEALLYKLTGSTIPATKIAGAVAVVIAFGSACRVVPDLYSRAWLGAMILLSPFVNLWIAGSLETPYLLCFVTLLTLAVAKDEEPPTPRVAVTVYSLCAACVLTRLDSAPFVAVAALAFTWRLRTTPKRLLLMLPPLALIGGWLVFASVYYHDVFPTSFHLKTPGVGSIGEAAIYVAQFIVLSGLLLLALATWSRTARSATQTACTGTEVLRVRWIAIGLVLQLAYTLTMALVHMMFAYRSMLPYLPAAALALLCASDRRVVIGPTRILLLAGTIVLQSVGVYWVYARSLNPGFVAEFRKTTVRERNHAREFFAEIAEAVRQDWAKRPQSALRSPRIRTFAGGTIPHRYKEAYIIESLVSFRKRCNEASYLTLTASADYIHTRRWTSDQSPERQLPRPLTEYEIVYQSPLFTDHGGDEQYTVYYQPNPVRYRLPPYVDGDCPPPDIELYEAHVRQSKKATIRDAIK